MDIKPWAVVFQIAMASLTLACADPPTLPRATPEEGKPPLESVVAGSQKTDASGQETDASDLEAHPLLTQVIDRQADLGLCQFSFDPQASRAYSQVYEGSNGVYLVQLLCFQAAYQGNYEFVRVDALSSPLEIRPLGLELVGYPTYDPETQILRNSYKYNGPGSCLEETTHRWDGDRLILVEQEQIETVPGGCSGLL
ncbi:DUF1176 domain-containing protein [Lyngbya confervoides]|uniref:DUF1176 domain-containing protein n=1 Tax=Lyngbya confervoides BDU141951 TaxID=1574623 RepID=A0ABD4T312_9CYAN|nr:DUF1176 domain-containing protein [Lyngbya confervoides]MCM1983132.1 DUF1176 domain-containing protein [Lyngbya confervoides BDU141951]